MTAATAATAAAAAEIWEDGGGGRGGTERLLEEEEEEEDEGEDEEGEERRVSGVTVACSFRRREVETVPEGREGEAERRRKACTRREGLQARSRARTSRSGGMGGSDGGRRLDLCMIPRNT